jgi:hypothetical protein
MTGPRDLAQAIRSDRFIGGRGGCRSWDSAAMRPGAPSPRLGTPLAEFGYGDVSMASEAHESQLMNTHAVLMALSEDSLLKPFRQMSGMPAPGEDLGGWYNYDPNYDYRKNFDEGFAPGCTFGQWVSALARATRSPETRRRAPKCCGSTGFMHRPSRADFYEKSRFPAYTYDKLLLGLLDSHSYVKDPQALAILEQTTNGSAAPAGPCGGTRRSVAAG